MAYQTAILGSRVEFLHQPFRKPLQMSRGTISEITEARAEVQVRVAGREATGYGSIYLSDLWAWPEPSLTHAQRDEVLRQISRRIADDLFVLCGAEAAHPLELGLRLHRSLCHAKGRFGVEATVIPALALAMCGSPFDAAIHDAVGQAMERSAFDLYDKQEAYPSADNYFSGHDAAAAIRRMLRRFPQSQMDAWLVVGARDLLPNDIQPWVRERNYRCFKLKLLARDNAEDVARTVEVFQAIRDLGVTNPRLCADTNEANLSAASVLDYLQRLRAADADAFAALEYLEQPTGRDIKLHAFDWRAVTRLKPVLLDEGLTDLDLLETAAEQGWSGLALKTCKGHSFALTAAAWAHQRNLVLTLQDLTNPGLAAIHAALFAAHVPVFNGVELNAAQYTPMANAPWLPRLQDLLEPRNGTHRLDVPHPLGLGSNL